MTIDEDKAREEAEARRQKILEQADGRIDSLTLGPNSKTMDSATVKEEEKPTASGASKLAAMRRRRFKKKEVATATETAKSTEVGTSAKTQPEIAVTDAVAAVVTSEPEPTGSVETPTESHVAAESKPPVAAETKLPAAAESDSPGTTKESILKADETKIKYLGIARLRRKIAKERQQKEEAAAATTSEEQTSVRLPSRKFRLDHALPILMHALTVLLLFAAGLDIGLQQQPALTVVHTQFAPQQYGIRMIDFLSTTAHTLLKSNKHNVDTTSSSETYNANALTEDEFAMATDKLLDTDPEIVDPLFRVDLNRITNQGTGIVYALARLAVQVHRFNLYVFYYGPKNFISNIFGALTQMLVIPPMLCVLCLVIRQVVGKRVLGAKLPPKFSLEMEGQQKDVLSMVKGFVTNLAKNTFPTITTLYDVWTHLRADMYVVLCGLIVGLVLKHGTVAVTEGPDVESKLVTDEL
jgi:hypothetical protein